MSASDPQTIRRAVQAWVAAGSGLPGNRVIWGGQRGLQPVKPYVSLGWIGQTSVGSDEVTVAEAADPQPGAEIEYVVRGSGTQTLSVQVYLTSTDVLALAEGMAILRNVRSERFAPDTEEALREAGVGVALMGPGRGIGLAIDTADFEPRAVMDVTINVGAEIRRTGTYIQSAEITNESTGETFVVPETTDAAGSASGTSGAAGHS